MCSANAGRICQAWSTGIPFPSRHRGNWSLCKSANQRDQTRQLQNHNRHTAQPLRPPGEGRVWAGKAKSPRLLSETHWPRASAFYGRGDTLKVSHHTPPAQTRRTQTALPLHLVLPLVFPVTRLRDVRTCLSNDQFTFFHIFMQRCERASWKNTLFDSASLCLSKCSQASPPLGQRLFLEGRWGAEGSSPWHRLYPTPTTISPFPADLNKAQFMPSHLPFFHPKPSFPAVRGDAAETELWNRTISPQKRAERNTHQLCSLIS